jgi:hypothetical protein
VRVRLAFSGAVPHEPVLGTLVVQSTEARPMGVSTEAEADVTLGETPAAGLMMRLVHPELPGARPRPPSVV